MQILDEGHLTDSQGSTVSFKNCYYHYDLKYWLRYYFSKPKKSTEKVKQSVETLLHKTFRPEFLNRIDAIVFFRMLAKTDVIKIAHIQVDLVKERLAERNITLEVTQEVLEKLADEGFEPEFGARPLKRAIQNLLSVPLAQYMLHNPGAQKVKALLKNNHITLQ